jgi:anti-sigma factor RsiW
MNHNDIRALLSSFIDDEVSESERLTVKAHLDSCPECKITVTQLMTIKRNVHTAGDFDLPYGFAHVLIRSIHHKQDVSMSWLGIEQSAQRLVFGLAIVVLMIVGLTSFKKSEEPSSAEHYVNGLVADTGSTEVLMKRNSISNDDVLIAVLTK